MAWTKMQEKAIYTRGSNIIVSAGAGSGKTAVLSERILEYCKNGGDITKVLVLTFTNAAATEMKERIRKKLIANNLLTSASMIDSAFITTFDAYSLAIVKKYYYYLNIDKNIGIIDQAMLKIKKSKLLDEIFKELYINKDENFFNLLTKYSKQNDDNIKDIVLEFLNKLELIVDEKNYVKNYEMNYFSDDFIDKMVWEYEQLALARIKILKNKLSELLDAANQDEASEKLATIVENLILKLNIDNYDTAVQVINSINLGRVSPKASGIVKDLKAECGELAKKIKENFFSKYLFLEDAKRAILATKEEVIYLLKLALELNQRLFEFKKEIMAFDYIDIAKMAINLVKDNQSVHDEISNNLDEILIDEYQDTSDIQEAFIQLISNNNCYMVGDIKQSIYRFRNANPYIFKNKYEKYALNDGGIKIDLTFNFRSRKEVLENINLIFSNLMTNSLGDADYSKDHIMHYGLKAYEDLLQDTSFDMEFLNYEMPDNFSAMEVEAFICASEIKKLIANKVRIFKDNKFKEISYNDIAVLIDKSKSFATFKKIFEYVGIPLNIESDLELNDSILPKIFANILILIAKTKENKYDKQYYHALASVGRSFLFQYSDDTIYQMLNLNLKNELHSSIEKLANLNMPIDEIYYSIIEEFAFYEKLPLIKEVENSCVVLEYINNLFKTIKLANMEILEAADYFSEIFEKGVSLSYKLPQSSTNSVHIMTIHKSKGLEFPYCFFPMLDGGFNKSEMRETFGISNKYGVYIPYFDEVNSNTIIKTLVQENLEQEDLSEKIRLFYVALTRAREKFYLIASDKEYKMDYMNKFNCFNQMLNKFKFMQDYKRTIDLDTIEITKDYKNSKTFKLVSGEQKRNYQNDEYLSPIISNKRISKELLVIKDNQLSKSVELGLEFHECFEVLDFNDLNLENLKTDNYVKETLKQVLALPIFENIKNAKCYQEHEFIYQDYHGIIDLLCIYDDHIDIIDYKLSNTDSKEYLKQLDIYKQYVQANSSLHVNCYLLSILKKECKKIY